MQAAKLIAHGSRRATLCTAEQCEARRALQCNKIQVTGSGANTEARAARSRVAVVGPSECRSCLLACHCLPTFLATYLHQMLVGPVDQIVHLEIFQKRHIAGPTNQTQTTLLSFLEARLGLA